MPSTDSYKVKKDVKCMRCRRWVRSIEQAARYPAPEEYCQACAMKVIRERETEIRLLKNQLEKITKLAEGKD